MRASYYLLGAMLGKYHHAEVSLLADVILEAAQLINI